MRESARLSSLPGYEHLFFDSPDGPSDVDASNNGEHDQVISSFLAQ